MNPKNPSSGCQYSCRCVVRVPVISASDHDLLSRRGRRGLVQPVAPSRPRAATVPGRGTGPERVSRSGANYTPVRRPLRGGAAVKAEEPPALYRRAVDIRRIMISDADKWAA